MHTPRELASPRAQSDRTSGMATQEAPRPLLPWLGRDCREAREEKGIVEVEIAAALKVTPPTIPRFQDGPPSPRPPAEWLMAYATELEFDLRLLWFPPFVRWMKKA